MTAQQGLAPAPVAVAGQRWEQELDQLRRDEAKAVADLRDEFRLELGALEARVADLEGQKTRLELVVAATANEAAAIHNRECRGVAPFRPFRKVVAGFGSGLPLAGFAHQASQGHPAPIGAVVPPGLWPLDIDAFARWDLQRVDALSRFLNDDFGVVPGDDLRTCRFNLYLYMLQIPAVR